MEIKLKKYQEDVLSIVCVSEGKTPEQYVGQLVELHLDQLFIKDRDERIMEFAKSMIDADDATKNKIMALIKSFDKVEEALIEDKPK